MFRKKNNIKSYAIKGIRSELIHYVLAMLVVGIVAILCKPLSNTQNYHVVSYILLFVVSILSTIMGIGPVLLAATISALVWNFFFIPPHLTFHIERTEDLLIFGLFFIIAFANGVLTTRVRTQEQLAREREKRTNALFQLTKELSKSSGIDEVLRVATDEIRKHFSIQALFLLQDGNNLLSSTGRLQKEKKLHADEYQIAEWCFRQMQKAGRHTANPFHIDCTFYPLAGTRINPGIVVVKIEKPFPSDLQSYWETFIAQISNALEREFLGELAQKVRFLDESDRLYKTLFNSISHELRIPVATIMGASDSIINSSNPEHIQLALCHEIFTASFRLNRLIENLLNISRLESGHISVRPDWYDLNDLVNKIANDLKDELKPFTFIVNIDEDMPPVRIDFGLMEQALYNLIFNSTQHAPGASVIELKAHYTKNSMIVEVSDQGPGFPESEIKNVFNKFYRVNNNQAGGLGLGLSIVKGFIEAHNGTICVDNKKEGGALFKIVVPSERPKINYL